jgi:replicative DNA helicase
VCEFQVRVKKVGPEIERIARCRDAVLKLPITFINEGPLTPPQFCQRVRQLAAAKGIKFIVGDYLQLLNLEGRRSPTEELGEGVKMIVGACNAAGLASLILSQLNRRSEEEKRRPQLGDFKQCGGIEEAAEVAILVHREWKMRKDETKPRFAKALEAIVAKLKMGEPATAWCYFEGGSATPATPIRAISPPRWTAPSSSAASTAAPASPSAARRGAACISIPKPRPAG